VSDSKLTKSACVAVKNKTIRVSDQVKNAACVANASWSVSPQAREEDEDLVYE